jgi:26S proteasome regulatory subunit N5
MSGGLLKPEKDFTKDADKLIPEAEGLAKVRSDTEYPSNSETNVTDSRPMSRERSISCWVWRSNRDRYDAECHPHGRSTETNTNSLIQASDLATTSRLLIAIVTISKNAGDWNLLNDQVLLLSKKHAQLKQATTKMVQTVMTFLDETPSVEVKMSVIETLRTVTEGKVGREPLHIERSDANNS